MATSSKTITVTLSAKGEYTFICPCGIVVVFQSTTEPAMTMVGRTNRMFAIYHQGVSAYIRFDNRMTATTPTSLVAKALISKLQSELQRADKECESVWQEALSL